LVHDETRDLAPEASYIQYPLAMADLPKNVFLAHWDIIKRVFAGKIVVFGDVLVHAH
jgi:hypothetical protein